MANKQDLEPLLNAQQNHLALLFSDSESTDAKALGIAAINVAILIFIGQASLTIPSWWQYCVLLVPFIASLLCDIGAIWPRKYIGPGVDVDASPEYLTMDRDTLVLQLLSQTQQAITTNSRLNRTRWRYCVSSLTLTALGTCVLFAML